MAARKTTNAPRKSRRAAQALRAADDNDTVALALSEVPAPRRGRKSKKAAQASEGMAVHLDPADLNARLAGYLYEADPKRMDVDRLERWAKANGLWDDRYVHLDGGRKRMCTGIKARKLLAAGQPLVFPS